MENNQSNNGIAKLAEALCKAQGVMSAAKKDKHNPFFKSKFSDLSSVFNAIREPFSSNGLAVSQLVDITESGNMVLKTILMHASGQFIESKMLLPIELNPQKLGSLLTYYKRYSLMAIAGLPSEDDDGNHASGNRPAPPQYITAKQVSDLENMINGNTKVRELVLSNCNGNMGSITVDRYPGAVEWIKSLLKESK